MRPRPSERRSYGSWTKRPPSFAATVAGKGGTPLGRIVIPKIKVDVVVIEGVGKSDLREGPGHWPETPFPGQGGNFVVSGHRTTYGAPFFKLDRLKAGDEIDLLMPYVSARYEVTEVLIVAPNQTAGRRPAGSRGAVARYLQSHLQRRPTAGGQGQDGRLQVDPRGRDGRGDGVDRLIVAGGRGQSRRQGRTNRALHAEG